MGEVDALVSAWVLARFRSEDRSSAHLRGCPDATVTHCEGEDGMYGCDTGCEYATLDAAVSCPHGESTDYTYGEFGDLAGIIESIHRDRGR